MAEWQLKVPAGVVPKNLPVYIALGIVAVLLLVMFLTGSGAPSDESAAGDEQAIEAAVADVRTVVEPVLREGERLREDLARLEAQRQADEEARSRQEEAARDEDLADARLELEGARAALLQAQRIRDDAERSGLPPGAVSGDIQAALETVEERELREAIRLQEVERFALSLRAPAVVGDRGAAAAAQRAAPAAPVITGDPLLDEQLLALLRQEAAAGQVPSPPPMSARAGAPEVVAVRPPPAAGAIDRGAAPPTELYAVGPDIEVPESSGRGGGRGCAVARGSRGPRSRLRGPHDAGGPGDGAHGRLHGAGAGAADASGQDGGPEARRDTEGHGRARRRAGGRERVPDASRRSVLAPAVS